MLPPPECVANATASQASPASSPIYQALRTYQAGGRGQLARNRAELTPEPPAPACSPACQWGICGKVSAAAWHALTGTPAPLQYHCVSIMYVGPCSWQKGWLHSCLIRAKVVMQHLCSTYAALGAYSCAALGTGDWGWGAVAAACWACAGLATAGLHQCSALAAAPPPPRAMHSPTLPAAPQLASISGAPNAATDCVYLLQLTTTFCCHADHLLLPPMS